MESSLSEEQGPNWLSLPPDVTLLIFTRLGRDPEERSESVLVVVRDLQGSSTMADHRHGQSQQPLSVELSAIELEGYLPTHRRPELRRTWRDLSRGLCHQRTAHVQC